MASQPLSSASRDVWDVGVLAEVLRGAFISQERRRLRDLSRSFRAFAEKDCAGNSPLHERIAARIANDSELLKIAAGAREGQPVAFLFFGAVHYLLLKETAHELSTFYPDLTSSPRTDDPYPAFRSFCLEHGSEIHRLVASRLVQTNDPQRSCSLLPALEYIERQVGGRPLALVEIGASAGLNLLWDRYSYDYGDGRRYGEPSSLVGLSCKLLGPHPPPLPATPPAVAFRIGIDLNPIDIEDADSILWLRALVSPEQRATAAILGKALSLARQDPPRIVRGDAVEVLTAVLRRVPAGAILCIFHSFALAQFTEEGRRRLMDEIASWGAKREVFLVSIEYSWEVDRTEIVVTHFNGASSLRAVLGYCDSHSTWLKWIAAGSGLEAPFGSEAGLGTR